jgi:hypothetical protein
MSDRYDLLTAREKDGKSYFTKIGVMFQNRSGDGFTCFFEALPISGPDGCKVIVKKADTTGNQGGARREQRPQPASAYDDADESAPF